MNLSQRLGWIGVDVGTHSVKLAQAVRDGGEVRLHRAAVIQRQSSWRDDDGLGTEQPLSSRLEIAAALECGRFIGRDVICALPMNVCKLRSLNVPPGSEPERRTIIADELAEEFGDVPRQLEFDFWELEGGRGDKGSDGFNVSVLATSRLWLEQLWRDCRHNKLDCWAVDGAPLAIARAVYLRGGIEAGGRVLAIDWGYSNTTLGVVGDQRPLYNRRIHGCSFSLVLEAVRRMFDVTLDQAQHLVEAYGLELGASEGNTEQGIQAAIGEAASEPIQELIAQTSRTLEFMAAQRRQLRPNAVWLFGGGASLRNVGPYLEEALRLPVRIWQISADDEPIECAAGCRSAVFGAAVALSSLAWRAA